jgi:hypothetical protein
VQHSDGWKSLRSQQDLLSNSNTALCLHLTLRHE